MADAPERIRVLFLSNDRGLNDFTGVPLMTGWYEAALAEYCDGRLSIGVVYPAARQEDAHRLGPKPFGRRALSHERPGSQTWTYDEVNGIAYYAVDTAMDVFSTKEEWEIARRALLKVIEEFEPDVIQVLGCEWPYGAIAEDVDVPVVVHMMGFLNVYYATLDMAYGNGGWPTGPGPLRAIMRGILGKRRARVTKSEARAAAFERRTMKANRFFMGRTEWDKNIVRYYSPGARYYHVPEFIRWPFIREAGTWEYHGGSKLRLLTVSSADDRKGNEIILRTAKLLKELIGVEFEWKVAGHKDFMPKFEQRTGIRCEDVSVSLLGMIEREQIVEELKAADLFIHPSIVDNSPNTICGSQLVGCPVIASNVGGVPQLVEHGVTGYLYPYNEPHTLAFLVANLAGARDELTRVSKAASEVARERHDPASIARRHVEVYEDILRTATCA